jgi:hypothetical protein
MSGAVRQGSGQQKALDCGGVGLKLVVSPPTSPVSVQAIWGSPGEESQLKQGFPS